MKGAPKVRQPSELLGELIQALAAVTGAKGLVQTAALGLAAVAAQAVIQVLVVTAVCGKVLAQTPLLEQAALAVVVVGEIHAHLLAVHNPLVEVPVAGWEFLALGLMARQGRELLAVV